MTTPTNQPTPVILDDEALTENDPIKEVDEILTNKIGILFSANDERRLIDLLSRLKNNVTELRREIDDYEQTNLVPRSRYEAVNADWLEARAQLQTLAGKAETEIRRIESENTALCEQLAEETKRADDNFKAYDRIKTKYSETVNRLAQVEKERNSYRERLLQAMET